MKSHTQHQVDASLLVQGRDIRPAILELIQKDLPNFNEESSLSIYELNHYRKLYLGQLLEEEKGELARIDQDVLTALRNNSFLSENIEPELERPIGFGDKLSDKIAEFGGSWTFIISFFSFLCVWMAFNAWFLLNQGFDPYPFILLNLILSCIAAIQAPIIMMSQNRQESKDRQRAEQDYKTNLKAELEIKLLNEKIDHLLINQNRKLLAIQEMQIDYLEDLMKRLNKGDC